MSIPNILSSSTVTGEDVSSIDLTVPSGVTSGDLLLIFAMDDTNAAGGGFSAIVSEAGWTQFVDEGSNVADCYLACYWKKATGSEATVTVPCRVTPDAVGFYLRTDGDGDDPIDLTGAVLNVSGTGTKALAGITTTETNTLAFYVHAADGGDCYPFSVSGGSWAKVGELQSTSASDGASGSYGTVDMASVTSTGDAVIGYSSADGCCGLVFNIRESGGGTTITDVNFTGANRGVARGVARSVG
jgi:hypothetical protein